MCLLERTLDLPFSAYFAVPTHGPAQTAGGLASARDRTFAEASLGFSFSPIYWENQSNDQGGRDPQDQNGVVELY